MREALRFSMDKHPLSHLNCSLWCLRQDWRQDPFIEAKDSVETEIKCYAGRRYLVGYLQQRETSSRDLLFHHQTF